MKLLANVADGDSARSAAAGPVEGVGLFRTELCFLNRKEEPTVEEQADVYAAVLGAFGSERTVVVRTLDAGSDKPIAFATHAGEENPALGWRALLYTELNPVRAGMVRRAVDYPWSSARVHCGLSPCPPWLTLHPWAEAYGAVEWGEILEVGFREHGELKRLREGLRSGRPLGEDAFIDELESKLGRPLRLQKTGRPPKAQSEGKDRKSVV